MTSHADCRKIADTQHVKGQADASDMVPQLPRHLVQPVLPGRSFAGKECRPGGSR